MLCDWQLPNSTGSLLNIISTAHQGRSWPLRVFFIFRREDASTPSLLPQLQSPTFRPPPQIVLQSSGRRGRLGRPQSRVETTSARSALGLRAFRLSNQCNGHTDANIHNKLSRDLHRISSSTFDFYRLLSVLLSYIKTQKYGISIS